MNTISAILLGACALGSSACNSLASGANLERAMGGAWRSTDGAIELLIEGPRCVQAQGKAQMLFGVQYSPEYALRTQLYLGQPVPGGLELDGDSLVLVDPVAGQDRRFQRLSAVPVSLLIEPFALGSAASNASSRESIVRELMRREKDALNLRRSIEESMHSARLSGRLNSFEDQLELMSSPKMVSLRDQLVASYSSNTEHIDSLLRSSGWITKSEYGSDAQLAAFNMVRFGGNLSIMQSVLPALALELAEDPGLGYQYTLLYDSTQLSLGRQQRYGTILLPDIDGRMRMRRVEHRAGLDQRRSQMGLPPMREFLANFEQQFGVIEVEN